MITASAVSRPFTFRFARAGMLCAAGLLAGCGGGGGSGGDGGGAAAAASMPVVTAPVAAADPAPNTAPNTVPAAPDATVVADPAPDNTTVKIASVVDPLLTMPAPGAVDVAADTPIVVAYEGAVRADATSAVLTNAQGDVPGTMTVAGNTIVFTPSTALSPDTAYTLDIVTEVPDGTGTVQTGSTTVFSTAAI